MSHSRLPSRGIVGGLGGSLILLILSLLLRSNEKEIVTKMKMSNIGAMSNDM